MLPVLQPDGRSTARQAVLFSAMLIPAAAAPFFLHMAGSLYLLGAVVGGVGMLFASVAFASERTDQRARRLFLGSIGYLPLLWVLLVLDRA